MTSDNGAERVASGFGIEVASFCRATLSGSAAEGSDTGNEGQFSCYWWPAGMAGGRSRMICYEG